LGEATIFPLIVYFVPLHKAHIQMAFCPRTPNGSTEVFTTVTPASLQAHNFAYKPPIKMKSLNNVVALVERFPMVCPTPPAREEIKVIPDF
jgi:hypothetical protein